MYIYYVLQTKWLLEKLIELICCSPTSFNVDWRLLSQSCKHSGIPKAVCEPGLRDSDLLFSKEHPPHLWSFRAGRVKCFFLVCRFFLLRGPYRGPSVSWAWSSIFHGLIRGSLHDLNKKQRRWCYNHGRLASDWRLAWLDVCTATTLCQKIMVETDLFLLALMVAAWGRHRFLFSLYLCRF